MLVNVVLESFLNFVIAVTSLKIQHYLFLVIQFQFVQNMVFIHLNIIHA